MGRFFEELSPFKHSSAYKILAEIFINRQHPLIQLGFLFLVCYIGYGYWSDYAAEKSAEEFVESLTNGDSEKLDDLLFDNPDFVKMDKAIYLSYYAILLDDNIGNDKIKNCLGTLFDHGLDVNSCGELGSFLHISVLMENSEIIEYLLGRGADIDMQNEEAKTPLHYAAESCLLEIANLLIENGAASNIKDMHGRTPYDYAVMARNKELAKKLSPK